MRKKLFFIVLAVLICSLFSVKQTMAEEFVAQCVPDNTDNRYIIATLSPLSQSFIASKKYITDIAVYLRDAGTVKFELIKPPDFKVVYTREVIATASVGQFIHNRFSPALEIEKGSWYWIRLSADPGVATTWIYTGDDCINSGQASYGWDPYNFIDNDFGFTVYGSDTLPSGDDPGDSVIDDTEDDNALDVATVKSNLAEVSADKEKGKENSNKKSFEIFSEDNFWQDPYFIAFVAVASLAIIGFTIWFLIDRRNKKRIKNKEIKLDK